MSLVGKSQTQRSIFDAYLCCQRIAIALLPCMPFWLHTSCFRLGQETDGFRLVQQRRYSEVFRWSRSQDQRIRGHCAKLCEVSRAKDRQENVESAERDSRELSRRSRPTWTRPSSQPRQAASLPSMTRMPAVGGTSPGQTGTSQGIHAATPTAGSVLAY